MFSLILPGFAANKIEIDGKMGTAEWSSAKHTVIFAYNSKSNCAINYAFMAYLPKPEERALYLCFNLSQKQDLPLNEEDSKIGVSLTFNDNSRYFFSVDGREDLPNSLKISPDKAFRFGSDNDLVIEIRLAFLTGLPEFPLKSVQFCDSEGDFSNLYLFEKEIPETTSSVTKPPSTTAPVKPTTTKPTTTKVQKYKVKFDPNGGKGGKTENLPAGTIPTPPTVTRVGHTFMGWEPKVGPVRSEIVYKAIWSKDITSSSQAAIKYKINFDSKGGQGGKTFNLEAGIMPSPPTVTRAGYIFGGWQPNIVPVSADMVYTAVWTKNTVPKSPNFYHGDTQYVIDGDDPAEEEDFLEEDEFDSSTATSDSIFDNPIPGTRSSAGKRTFALGQVLAVALASLLIALSAFIFLSVLFEKKRREKAGKDKSEPPDSSAD